MGKGELWDDSALVDAFDEAMFKYTKMNGKTSKENSNRIAGDASPAGNDADEEEVKSYLNTDHEGRNDDSHASVEMAEAQVSEKGKKAASSQVLNEEVLGLNNLPVQEEAQNNSSSLAADEYNQLYKQYYEVEEQRQKILQKLQSFSWNYADGVEASVSAVEWGTAPATQEYQSAISQEPCGTMVVSCCPYACSCSMASCSSLPCCSPCTGTLLNDSSALTGYEKLPAVQDADFVKMAMGAAERAVSTLKGTTSDWKVDNTILGRTEATSPETDLSTVLNAWYSAGLYTGKYLTEQSFAKKQHG